MPLPWHKRGPEPEQPQRTFSVRYYLRDDHNGQVVKNGKMLWGIYQDGHIGTVEPFSIPGHHSIEWLLDPAFLMKLAMEHDLANPPI